MTFAVTPPGWRGAISILVPRRFESPLSRGNSECGPTTLLTRFAEELRRVGVGLTAGGGGLEWSDENGSRGE